MAVPPFSFLAQVLDWLAKVYTAFRRAYFYRNINSAVRDLKEAKGKEGKIIALKNIRNTVFARKQIKEDKKSASDHTSKNSVSASDPTNKPPTP